MRFAALFALLVATALAGCAPSMHTLQRQSARGISPTPYPDSVKISDVHDGSTRTWVATTRSGVYDCSIEDRERGAICVKRESPR
ncbi:MAG TPA: hypothetical protein VK636_19955 [Gemmatimonadaceae bacterium]|nr:hypothetical protein [Gemmatimonadaceae bacterium]